MKKGVFALMAALLFVACGSKQEEAPAVEEVATEVAVDSAAVEVEAVEEVPAEEVVEEAPVQE